MRRHLCSVVFRNSPRGGARLGISLRGDQVIRENPASRGTETSAEDFVGPPGRMVSNAGPIAYRRFSPP
jgi:hypothetical protein